MYATRLSLLRDAPLLALVTSLENQRDQLYVADLDGAHALPPEAVGARWVDGARLLVWAEDKLGWSDARAETPRWVACPGPLRAVVPVEGGLLAWGPSGVVSLDRALQEQGRFGESTSALLAVTPMTGQAALLRYAGSPGARCVSWRTGEALAELEEPLLDAQVLGDGESTLLLSARRAVVTRWRPREGSLLTHALPGRSLGGVRLHTTPHGLAVVEGWERQLWWVHPEEGVRAGPTPGDGVLGLDASGARVATPGLGQLRLLREGEVERALPWGGPDPTVRFADDHLLATLPMRAERWDLTPPGRLHALQFAKRSAASLVTEDGRILILNRSGALSWASPLEEWVDLKDRHFQSPRPLRGPSPPAERSYGHGDAEAHRSWFGAPGLGAAEVLAALEELGATARPVNPFELEELPCGLARRAGWFCLYDAPEHEPALHAAVTRRLGAPVEVLSVSARGEIGHAAPDDDVAPCRWGERSLRELPPSGEVPEAPRWSEAWVDTIDLDRVPPPYTHRELEEQLMGAVTTHGWLLLQHLRFNEGGWGAWSVELPEPPPEPQPGRRPDGTPIDLGSPRLTLLLPEPLPLSRALELTLRGALSAAGVLDTKGEAPMFEVQIQRLLRRGGLSEPPLEGSPEREAFDGRLLRMTQRQRSATASNGRRIPSWKLDATGQWIFTADEVQTLLRWLPQVSGEEAEALTRALERCAEGCSVVVAHPR